MKSLPSLKDKRRYLVFKVISGKKHAFAETKEAIIEAAARMLGTMGLAKAKLKVMADRFDFGMQQGVLMAERKSINNAKAVLCAITKINGEKAIIRSLGVSGILKKAVEKYVQKEG